MARAKSIWPHISSRAVHCDAKNSSKTAEVLFAAQDVVRAESVGNARDKGNMPNVSRSGHDLAGCSLSSGTRVELLLWFGFALAFRFYLHMLNGINIVKLTAGGAFAVFLHTNAVVAKSA